MQTTTSLNEGWTLSLVDGPVPSGFDRLDDVPATVPGCAHTDLLAAGLIPDPLDGDNEERLAWLQRCSWRYRLVFDAVAPSAGEHSEIVFDGLDTVATVTLNGTRIGSATDQFIKYRYDVSQALVGGANELVVEFESALEVAEERERRHGSWPHVYEPPFNMVRKSACSFGWDWGPVTITAGIWKPVRLERWTGARVRDVRLGVDLVDGSGVARLVATVERDPGARTSRLEYAVGGVTVAAEASSPGSSEVVLEAVVDRAEAWWPRGYGEQPLYDSALSLDGDEVWTRRVGFRHAELDMTPDETGTPLRLTVNGELVLAKGVNWIPDDVFPTRITRDRYRRALQDAVDSGCNIVRVWGGGLYESEDFYDATDELGLLVWQDFLFACAAYSEEDWLKDDVVAEARQAVGRLAGRASLVLWCGNNENETGFQEWGWQEGLAGRAWGQGYYRRILPEIVAELDPSTPYIPSSPFSPDPEDQANNRTDGDTHVWDVWNELDYLHYADQEPRFASEFGFGGPMAWSTLEASVHDEPLARDGAQLAVHQKADDGFAKLRRGIDNHLSEPVDMRHWHWATQLNQARALAFGVSHFRSLQPSCTGTIIWQLNDCWPVISWAVVDSAGVRKPGWHALAHAQEDRALVLKPAQDGSVTLTAVNDLAEEWKAAVRIGRGTRHGGEVQWDDAVEVSVDPRSARTITLSLPDDPDGFVIAEADGARRATWFLATDREAGLPAPEADVDVRRVEDGYEVSITARSLLRDLDVAADVLAEDAVVSDSLLTLLPGETTTIRVRTATEISDPAALGAWPVRRTANDLAR